MNKIAYDAKTVNNVTTYLIDVLPTRVPAYMRSGMTANVSFPIGVKTGVLIVPSDVIKSKDGRPFVLVPSAEAKGKPDRRDITLGNSDGKRVEIASGLSEGDSVLQPEFKLGAPKTSSGSPLSPMGTGGRH